MYGQDDQIREIQAHSLRNSKEWFPHVHRSMPYFLVHSALGLAGETGEAVDVIKKWHRNSASVETIDKDKLGAELADVFIYLLHICSATGIDLSHEFWKKAGINEKRFGDKS